MCLTKLYMAEHTLIGDDHSSEVQIHIGEKIFHQFNIEIKFPFGNLVPLHFIPGVEPMFYLKVPNISCDSFTEGIRTPYAPKNHGFLPIMFKVATFVTIYVVQLIHQNEIMKLPYCIEG